MRENSSEFRDHRNQSTEQTSTETSPDIDVVIAVHTATRPIQRAVNSCVVGQSGPRVRVTVVCHNIPSQEILHSFTTVEGFDVRFLELDDGLNSPAGPKNAGLEAATAPYICLLDSDDYLEDGALDHWYEVMQSEQADVVLAPVRHESGDIIKTPRARPRRVANLDPIKDGLVYATAMRGLWRADVYGIQKFKYAPGLRVGEDLTPGLKLYFSGARFFYPKKGPAYVLGNEAIDRVTGNQLLLTEEFRAIKEIPSGWLDSLSHRQRKSVAIKLAKTSLIGAIIRRGVDHNWQREELSAIRDLTEFLDNMSPGYKKVMTIRDARLLRNSLSAGSGNLDFRAAIQHHQQGKFVSRTLSDGPINNFHRESQIRQIFRVILDRRP